LSYKKNKVLFNFGTRFSDVQFHQADEFNGNVLNRNFINWLPQVRFEYHFSQQRSFLLTYSGATIQPTLDQLQPIRTNTDPLNIILGNPGLTPSFSNTFFVNYRSYKILTNQFFQIAGNYSFTTDPIVNHINYDPATGQSSSQYFNLPGKETTNYFFRGILTKKMQSLGGLNAGIAMNGNGNTGYNYTNNVLNKSTNFTINPTLVASMYKEKKFQFGINGGPTYTISQSSLQPQINNNGWGARGSADATVFLIAKFQFGTYSEYQYNGKTASFNQDFSRTIINLFLIKSFLKNDSLKLTLWANDLFNQNAGFTRTANANMITQNSYTNIKRYFMFTINYDFTRMGGGASKN